jgi:hypothetical protein
MRYEKARVERVRIETNNVSNPREPSGGAEESKSAIEFLTRPKESPDGFELKIEPRSKTLNDSDVAIKYLEGVVKQGCRSGAVFRYLMSLYTAMEDEEPLLEFLSNHVSGTSSFVDAAKKAILAGDRPRLGADDTSSTPLDMSYALRAVLGTGRHFRSAIKLYMGFGMRTQAVELALKVDPALARQLSQDSVEIGKVLLHCSFGWYCHVCSINLLRINFF